MKYFLSLVCLLLATGCSQKVVPADWRGVLSIQQIIATDHGNSQWTPERISAHTTELRYTLKLAGIELDAQPVIFDEDPIIFFGGEPGWSRVVEKSAFWSRQKHMTAIYYAQKGKASESCANYPWTFMPYGIVCGYSAIATTTSHEVLHALGLKHLDEDNFFPPYAFRDCEGDWGCNAMSVCAFVYLTEACREKRLIPYQIEIVRKYANQRPRTEVIRGLDAKGWSDIIQQ